VPEKKPPAPTDAPVSFAEFFWIWAQERRWKVPAIHWRVVDWLEHRGDLAVLRLFRGGAKSTVLAVYNAWRYYRDPRYRILHQGDQDGTAHKTARDTRSVLERHPLTRHMAAGMRGEVSFWWVPGADDERNPSMQAAGILSNITSSRADEVQNDDVEVPKNIQTPEAREKLRYRLGEQTHILVPGGRALYVGTPHTHDSLYDEQERLGADCLTIPMFDHEYRADPASLARYVLPFVPEVVFSGIGEHAALLKPGRDYLMAGKVLTFKKAPGSLVDFYAGNAWPERFDLQELLKRRKKCRTVNEWDSQYQLHSKPIGNVRLDPDRLAVYDVEPVIRTANRETIMMLGNVRIVGAALRWDPAGGKLRSDVSAVAVCLQDDGGRRYLHRVQALTGDIAETSEDGREITGGQVWQLCDIVERFELPRITVETNGIGKFAPATLKAALKQRGLAVGVKEVTESDNKNKRILESWEPLLKATDMLWCHQSVIDGPLTEQMRGWNPIVPNQPDDYLDAGAGAIGETPERIGKLIRRAEISAGPGQHDWRPSAGMHEVLLTD
jgi:hypothetical protein